MNLSNSKVCVVGGAGFLGSHLVDYLIEELDCTVSVIDDLSIGRKEFVHPEATLFEVDITDKANIRGLFKGIDFVFNYAARPFIPNCLKNPVDTLLVNTIGSLQVIEEACNAGCKRILQVSSAEVYGNTNNYHEADAWFDPPSTYAVSKVAIDALSLCRYTEVKAPVIVLRQFNCLGEKETHPYVIPEIIDQVYQAKADNGRIAIRLGDNTRRDFLYAGDAVRMAAELLEKGKLGEAYNLGSEDNITIYTLARKITDLMRPGLQLTIKKDQARVRPQEIWALKSSNKKINKVIDYRPRVSLQEALQKTIHYYQRNNNSWGW